MYQVITKKLLEKMSKKRIISAVLLLVLNLASISAITGSLGNSRMILHIQPGETEEKFLLVKNVNEFPITVEITVTGDLAKNLQIKEESFSLNPEEEKKAYFSITAGKEGTTETRLNVRFTPPEGNGVGLTSVIIVVSEGDDSMIEDEKTEENIEDTDFKFEPKGGVPEEIEEQIRKNSQLFTFKEILVYLTIILAASFFILLAYYLKTSAKKRVRRPRA